MANYDQALFAGTVATRAAGNSVRFGPFIFRLPERVLEARGKRIPLGGRATAILATLLAAQGELVSHQTLQKAVWPDTAVEESALRVHLSKLRRALASEDPETDYLVNEAGRGYRFALAVDVTKAPDAFPFQRTSLPARVGSIHGRSKIIDELRTELLDRRFVTIAGPAGIGKTTVAVAVAARFQADGLGICFVDFASVTAPQLVLSTMAVAAGVAVGRDDPVPDILATLVNGDFVLVFDNCEHLLEPIAVLAERLLRGAPQLHLLVTSQEPLRAEGEWVHRISSLPTPPASKALAPADALDFASVSLFVERAMAARSDFALTPGNLGDVCDICRRLDGIPLAIELTAARTDAMDTSSLALGLDDRFALLTVGRRTALTRHQTMRAALDWSYELLTPMEQAFLRMLAVFRSSFDLAGAVALASHRSNVQFAALEMVTKLCAKSLVSTETIGAAMRYRLLDTMRHYAFEKLKQCEEVQAVRRHHATYCRELFSEPRDRANATLEFLSERRRYIDDLRTAIDWAFSEAGDAALGVELVVSAATLWFHFSLTEEFFRLAEQALRALPAAGLAGSLEEAELLCVYGHASLHATVWPTTASAAAFTRALQIAVELDNRRLQLRAMWGLWMHEIADGSYTESVNVAERYNNIALSSGTHDKDVQNARRMLVLSHHLVGNQEKALQFLGDHNTPNTHLDISSHTIILPGDNVMSVLSAKMRILWLRGFPDRALSLARELAEAAIASGHDLIICANLSFGTIPVALWCGDFDLAREQLSLLCQRSQQRGLRHWAVWASGFESVLEPQRSLPNDARTFQLDIYATVGSSAAVERLIRHGRPEHRSWCRPELLRLSALREEAPGSDNRRARLLTAFTLAQKQGLLAWQLRAAMSLAIHDTRAGKGDDGPELLAQTVAQFTEGSSTRDLVAATDFINGTRDRSLADV